MCLITQGVAKPCEFNVGGVSKLYLANYDDIAGYTDADADDIIDTINMGQLAITNVTNANPAEVETATAHGYQTGDTVWILGTSGMSGLANASYEITVTAADTFTLTGFNSTTLAAFAGSSLVAVQTPFFEVKLEDNSVAPAAAFKTTGGRYFLHSLTATINNMNTSIVDFLEELALARVVALVKDKNGRYSLFGKQNGLTAREDDSVNYVGGPTAADALTTVTLTGDETSMQVYIEWDGTSLKIPIKTY